MYKTKTYRFLVLLALAVPALAAPPADTADRARRRSSVVEVFEKCRDAVVNISTKRVIQMRSLAPFPFPDDIFDSRLPPRSREVQSIGSGVLVHPAGYVVTNAHVVAQASDVRVTFADGHSEPAVILAADNTCDLAVLKLEARRKLPWIQLGRSHDIMIGETVIAIGNPLGLHHTVTVGIVSALDRELNFPNNVAYRGLIQTDASINPGNSGGPLLNVNAELIGINTAMRGDAQNIGFAIPADRLWELLPVMLDIERRERVRFGLRVSGPQAEVLAVRPDSPAAQAGLRVGDRVVRFNGEKLRDGIDYYVHLLEQKPGSQVTLGIRRGDKLIDSKVVLQAIPLPDGQKLAQQRLGVELAPLPKRIREKYDLPPHVGVMVEAVEAGSPADKAGMIAGDVILRIDRITTANLKDIGLSLETVTPGDIVLVEGLRLNAATPFIWQPVAIKTR